MERLILTQSQLSAFQKPPLKFVLGIESQALQPNPSDIPKWSAPKASFVSSGLWETWHDQIKCWVPISLIPNRPKYLCPVPCLTYHCHVIPLLIPTLPAIIPHSPHSSTMALNLLYVPYSCPSSWCVCGFIRCEKQWLSKKTTKGRRLITVL